MTAWSPNLYTTLKSMNRVLKLAVLCIWICGLVVLPGARSAETPKPVYENHFESAALDETPADFLVIQGPLMVKAGDGNRWLEVPGTPVDSYGFLFGPTESAGFSVTARIRGTGKGRRFPTFSVGLNGYSGFKLQASPAKGLIELFHGDALVSSAPLKWTSDTWTHLRLQVREAGAGKWKVEGRLWKEGDPEPAEWVVSHELSEEPRAGRASASGSPYSGTPILFDDLVVAPISGANASLKKPSESQDKPAR